MSTSIESPHVKPAPKPPQELVHSTTYLLKRLGWSVKDRFVDAFEAAGASPYHYPVLALLEEDPRETQAAIADALGYDRSWLVGLLDELEEEGLIERRRDQTDRRRHVVSLQPAGKKKLAQLRAINQKVEEDFLAGLDADERAKLHKLLRKLAVAHDPRFANGDS